MGTNSVILRPIVLVILFPAIKIPKTSAIAPNNLIERPTVDPTVTYNTAVAAAISIAPTPRAAKDELPI